MMKFLILGALSTASVYFAQSYPASAIPENLKKNADAVIRKNFTTAQINKIDEIVYQYNKVTTVLNKDGDSKAAIYIPYQKGDGISNVKVTIYDEAGKKVKSFSKSDFTDFANNSNGVFYSDNRVLVLPYTSAHYPYTVDFSYELTDENTIFIPDFEPFSSTNTSLEEGQFKIINKSGIELRTKIYPSKYNYASVTESGSGAEKTYTFKNVPAIENALLMPDPVKILPKVDFSLAQFNLAGKKGSLNNWKDFGTWCYTNLIEPVAASGPAIKAEVAALKLEGSTEDKVRKLYQHMQSKTRYIYVGLGIGGWLPMQPDEVHRKGYGDCKGLTNYMKVLLNEAGIPSTYCVINSSTSSVSFDPDFPSMGGNHAILMVPTEKGNIWLENTSQQTAFNHLSYHTTDRNVLAMTPKGIELINTPAYKAEENREKQMLKININEDNSITGEGNFFYTGNQYDTNLRFANLDPKEKNDAIKNRFNVLNFEKIEVKNFNNDRNKAVITYDLDFKTNNFSKNAGSSILFRAIPILEPEVYKTDESRELPFEIWQSYQDDHDIAFTIPKGYKIDEIPGDSNISSEFGNYTLSFVKDNGQIKVTRKIQINKGIYPKEKYNDYVNFRKKIMNMDNSKILITKI
ncbi:DUF3857 domain-containing protein [Chryseobacterium arthrosphaerae]|uniref:DUF3857 domain-containing protein n=1 Tax=Chryseobacterium arthrosphaerae TaxID=651561 RepID=A0A1B8ZNQ0_9FLAO|nr:DUF3857 domain-containing protein [Chryseobacterium arthrosphaerae]OCA73229.1 DUF3857 domain-containing protein [Chryseobacterium arthrosphaerae]